MKKVMTEEGVRRMQEYNARHQKMVFSPDMLDHLSTPAALLTPLTAETVLQKLFPEHSALIKNMSKMLQTERAHLQKSRK